MSTLTQILLVIVITTLTVTLTIIGVQVFLVLKDLRERISRFDSVMDNLMVEQQYLNEILSSAKETSHRVSDTTKYVADEVILPIANLVSAVKSLSQFVGQFRAPTRHREALDNKYEQRR